MTELNQITMKFPLLESIYFVPSEFDENYGGENLDFSSLSNLKQLQLLLGDVERPYTGYNTLTLKVDINFGDPRENLNDVIISY